MLQFPAGFPRSKGGPQAEKEPPKASGKAEDRTAASPPVDGPFPVDSNPHEAVSMRGSQAEKEPPKASGKACERTPGLRAGFGEYERNFSFVSPAATQVG